MTLLERVKEIENEGGDIEYYEWLGMKFIFNNENNARPFTNYCLTADPLFVISYLLLNEQARKDYVHWLKVEKADHFKKIVNSITLEYDIYSWRGSYKIVKYCLEYYRNIIQEYITKDDLFAIKFTKDSVSHDSAYLYEFIRNDKDLNNLLMERVIKEYEKEQE